MEDLHQRAHKRRRRLVNRDTIVEEALEGAAVCCRVPAPLCSCAPMLTACNVPFRAVLKQRWARQPSCFASGIS